MNKSKTETGNKFFHVRQSRTQEREICLRVDKDVKSEDLIDAFDWDTSNEVFLYMGKNWDVVDGIIDDSEDWIVELQFDSGYIPHLQNNYCDVSLNEDGTLEY